MDKVIYGGDTETCEGEPITFQFYSEDDGHECDDLLWLDDPNDALDKLLIWCRARARNRQHVVYVHNLDFDAVSYFWPKKEMLASPSGEFDFVYKKWRFHGAYGSPTFFRVSNGHDKIVHFVDSFSWMRTPLWKAAELFCPHLPKLRKPANLGTTRYKPSDHVFVKYAMRDAEIGYHMGRAIEAIHQEFDISQCVSIADTAARIFRHQYVEDPIPLPTREILEASLLAYHGGKNNFVGKPGWYRNVTGIDISSAYPDAMQSFPAFTNAKAYKKVKVARVRSVPELGVYQVRGKLSACDWPIFYSHAFKPLDPGTVSGVWVTGFELNEAIRSKEFVLDGAIGFFYDATLEKSRRSPPMRRFVEDFYDRKQKATDKVKRTFYKYILNSLSGKFIQTRKKAERDTVDEDDNYTGDARFVAGGLFHPFIAALITGHTRARIHQMEHDYKAIHTATDGIVTRMRVNAKTLGEGVGSLAVEARGDIIILRNKLYIFYADMERGDDKDPKVTPSSVFKGKKIVKYALHGFQGTVADLEKMIASGRRKYVKEKPNRLKQALKRGLVPNKFEQYKGTLKVGDLLVRS